MKTIRLKSLRADRDGLLVEWDGTAGPRGYDVNATVKALEDRPEHGIRTGDTLTCRFSNLVEGEEVKS